MSDSDFMCLMFLWLFFIVLALVIQLIFKLFKGN